MKSGITSVILPKGFYKEHKYDKWGNIILPNGTRVRGELFFDESVQKILKPVLDQFTPYVKYPSTPHLPTSPNIADDDTIIDDFKMFDGKEVVVTEKMDGENSLANFWMDDF